MTFFNERKKSTPHPQGKQGAQQKLKVSGSQFLLFSYSLVAQECPVLRAGLSKLQNVLNFEKYGKQEVKALTEENVS